MALESQDSLRAQSSLQVLLGAGDRVWPSVSPSKLALGDLRVRTREKKSVWGPEYVRAWSLGKQQERKGVGWAVGPLQSE